MEKNKKLFEELIEGLLGIYDKSVQSIILFGSVAKGTETPESDIDVAVIYTHEDREQHEKMLDLVTDLDLKYDKIISVIMIEETKFKIWGNTLPFYKNVKKDGIELWKAA